MVVAFSTAAVECARKVSADMTQVIPITYTFVDIWNRCRFHMRIKWGGGGGGVNKWVHWSNLAEATFYI